jgi:hypothetical protein
MVQVLPETNRNAGTYNSGDFPVPNPGSDHRLTYTMSMSDADAANAANRADILVEGQRADSTWYLLMGTTWNGGQTGKDGLPIKPSISLGGSQPLPSIVRGTVVTNRRWAWGVDMTTSET